MAPQDNKKMKTPPRATRSLSKTPIRKINQTSIGEKSVPPKATVDKTPRNVNNVYKGPQKMNGVSKTPKGKEIMPMTAQTVKPAWKRRPMPAHSGVPVPEKMRKLFEKIRREKLAAAAAGESASMSA